MHYHYYLTKRTYIGSRDEIDPDDEIVITKSFDDLPMGETVGYGEWTETTFTRTLSIAAARQVTRHALQPNGGVCRRIDGADPADEPQTRPLDVWAGEVEIWAAGDAPTASMEVTLSLISDAEATVTGKTSNEEIAELVEDAEEAFLEVAQCYPHSNLEDYLLQLRNDRREAFA